MSTGLVVGFPGQIDRKIAMLNVSVLLVCAMLLLAPRSASAQPKPIDHPADREWKHKPSGLKLPASLAGLPRRSLANYAGDQQLDVAGGYRNADDSAILTVYLFRDVSGSIPVWFDRARGFVMNLPDRYPSATSTGIRPFTPRGQAAATGLMDIMTTSGDFGTTGVMLLPVNGFYAKIRASITDKDPARLERLMLDAVNQIDWRSKAKARVAAPIADCTPPILPLPAAKLATTNNDDRMTSALMGSLFAQINSEPAESIPDSWCREPGPFILSHGIYRASGLTDTYLLALLDSGRAVAVGGNTLTALLAENGSPRRYGVSHVDLDATTTYADFESLPQPQQAIDLVNANQPLSRATTWGKGSDISVYTK